VYKLAAILVRRPWLPPALLAIFGVTYALVARVAFRAYPFSGDEYSAQLQGEIFARGLLRVPAPPHAELFGIDHVVIDQWVRTKYPPGASALLAIGERAGLAWLVTPLEGVVALTLVWLTARALFGHAPALVSLVLLGVAPLFGVEAGSFYSHTAAVMWVAASFGATTAWTLSKRDAWLVLSGAALGCAFLTRPLDALLFGAALLALRSKRVVILTALGAAPFLALHFAYQAAQFGSPFIDGYTAYEPTFRAIYGADASKAPLTLARIVDPEQQWFHLAICTSFVTTWTAIGTTLLAIFGLASVGKDDKARPMRDVTLALVALALVSFIPSGDDGPRPRYLSTTLLVLAYFVGPGWDAARALLEDRLGPRITRALVVTSLLGSVVQLGTLVVDRADKIGDRDGLFDATRAAGVTDGVVVVRTKFPTRYARNGAFFDRPVLYLSAPATMTADAVAELYPGRAVYEAIESRDGPWSVVRRR
jgi:hypothetical protein